jgi:uncharacterized protein
MTAQRAQLPDGRWHFQHGPMDIVIGADGDTRALASAHEAAWSRFQPLLDELVGELALLRRPVGGECRLRGDVARCMWRACKPFERGFITPMAAVAGAVAQALVECYERAGVERAWVNNGGDIALHLAPERALRVGLYADLARLDARELREGLTTDGRFDVTYAMPVRGVATSGWRGRSFSLGIADSVTVLAATAAEADAAATVIANAVDVADPRIVRRPACELKDDSDLGAREVTVDVPPLPPELVRRALDAGARVAGRLRVAGLIHAAVLTCKGQAVLCVGEPKLVQ